MRRLLVASVVVAVMWALIRPATDHVHTYGGGHDHIDHHHGPATHDHHRLAPSSHDVELRLSGCTPADHTVFLPRASRTGSAVFGLAIDDVERCLVSADEVRVGVIAPVDARQHSPPHGRSILPRAPPALIAA